jgi:glucosyl-3-phosphoglycerate synthase
MRNREVQSSKLVVFDMDNTLLQDRFIEVCARHYKFEQALSLLRHIDHDPVSLTMRIGWFLKDRKRSELLEIANSIPLVPGIEEVVDNLKKRGYTTGIISDSYQLVTRIVADKINADFELANELQFIGDHITGEVLIPSYFKSTGESSCVHSVCKTNALRYICKAHHANMEDCIVIGDSENDVCMLSHAGLRVAFCTTSELVKSVANKHIVKRSFSELLSFVP